MSINLTIAVECDDDDDLIELIGTMMRRYHRVTFTVDQTDHYDDGLTDDEMAEDFDAIAKGLEGFTPEYVTERLDDDERLTRLEDEMHEIINNPDVTSEMLGGMIADVRGVQAKMTHSNTAMRRLEIVIDTLQARWDDVKAWEAHQARDDAPAHGIPRPISGMTPTRGAGDHVANLEIVQCPSCHAGFGKVCRTDTGNPYQRGFGHAARRQEFAKMVAGKAAAAAVRP